ncbi:MAG: DnaJ C-terminal domain-containing protein [Candidatus Tectimicrobiota bacterium]
MATAARDYYEILGVPRDADDKAIKAAFRDLAMQYHPDRNKAPHAEEKFKAIAEAYAVLSNPQKRAEYDAGGVPGGVGFTTEELFRGMDFDDLFSGFGFGTGSVFERFLRRRPAGPAPGAALEVTLEIPLRMVLSGGQETVHFTRPVPCSTCHGSGAAADTPPRACTACHGSGQRVQSRSEQGVMFQQITACPTCHGQGMIIEKPCETCHGLGQTTHEEHLSVTIPAGVEDGMILRVPGHGLLSSTPGGLTGDLLVLVRSRPDPRFTRRGADLWHLKTLDVVEAVLGTSQEIPTLDGQVTVTIPPGTQPATVLRLAGKGLPVFGESRRGDVFVQLQVQIPTRLSAKERKLYERLRALQS